MQFDATPMTPVVLGATIRLHIHDVWHPDGASTCYRLVGMASRHRRGSLGSVHVAERRFDSSSRGAMRAEFS
ncbi:hypothetical protein [Streptomyces noursei]|uniref:hypothetical protein n=1 Tax=Streptomyces noursei TaxID=1971 RepID=UPI0030F2E666